MANHQIRVAGRDAVFTTQDDESILDAALRHGLLLPHDCRSGGCGACKGRVLCGEIDHGDALDTTLSPDERAQGYALFCSAHAHSDLVIEPSRCEMRAEPTVRRLALRVLEVRHPGPERALIRLEMPAAKRLRFRSGQQLDVRFADGSCRRYEIVSSPDDEQVLEFEVPRASREPQSDYLCDGVQRGETLRIEGPHERMAASLAA